MRSKETARLPLVLLLPALVVVLSGAFNHLREPFFRWADPDYPYLLNALRVAEGAAPVHNDHPGTPLQAMGALLLHARHVALGRPHESLREHVLREPEAFLASWRDVMRGLYVVALAGGGLLVLRVTRSLSAALLFQLLPLLSLQSLLSLSRVAAETALMTMGVVMAALTVAVVTVPDRWGGGRTAAVLGALAGLGVATKVVFAPVALVPVAALDRRGRRVFAAAAVTAFFLGLAPIATRLPATVLRLWSFATHTGPYGTGAVGVVDQTRLSASVALLLREEWLTLALIVTALAAGLANRGRAAPGEAAAARVLVATAALQAAWLAIALRHFDRRYLVPAATLNGLQVVLLWTLGSGSSAVRIWRATLVGLVCAAVALSPMRLAGAAGDLERTGRGRADAASFLARIQPAVEDSYTLSQPGALQLGDTFAGGRFGPDLRRLYPAFVSWDGSGAQAFGEPLSLGPLLHTQPGGHMTLLAMVHDYSPVLRSPPAHLEPQLRYRFLGHALYEARVAPCIVDAGPFAGFVEASGLRATEGPYPQLGLPRPVRWGLQPETSLSFVGGSDAMALELAARHEAADARRIRVWLNGALLERLELPPSRAFQPLAVRFQPRPGLNEMRLQYGPREPGRQTKEELAVLFERLRLSCAAGANG